MTDQYTFISAMWTQAVLEFFPFDRKDERVGEAEPVDNDVGEGLNSLYRYPGRSQLDDAFH